jgi:hypothetical protein
MSVPVPQSNHQVQHFNPIQLSLFSDYIWFRLILNNGKNDGMAVLCSKGDYSEEDGSQN